MERSLWLGAALALGQAACSASGGGGSTLMTGEPATSVDDAGAAANGGGTGSTNGAGGASGNPAGDTAGSANAGDNGSSTGGDFCEQFVARADRVIPDLLIVLDKSGSMVWPGCAAAGNPIQAGCSNGVSTTPPYQAPFDRWAPSVAALKTTTAALQDRVRFGLMIFPDDPLPGLFPPLTNQGCQPGVMFVDPALNTAAQISSELDAETADGDSTPIPGTLRAAHATLGTGIVGPDESPTPKYVLLVTDGGPNCTVDGQPAATLEEANMQSYTEIDSLTSDGIKTYVIGYDTRSTADLAVVLDEMARRGGTGDTAHREVTDENSLLEAISAIAGQVTTCTYQLDKAPPDVKKVRVTLDGKDRKNGPDGWELTGERTIELRGAACTEIQNAEKQHTLAINVECEDVIIE